MEIVKTKDGDKLTVAVIGRLDTTTSPQLEQELEPELGNVKKITFDFEKLDYISSAGLRVLLAAQKTMNKQGSMVICNVSPEVKEIFDVTGFSDILTIE